MWCSLGSTLCKHAGDHSVTTEACSSLYLARLGLCGMVAWKLIGAICAMDTSASSSQMTSAALPIYSSISGKAASTLGFLRRNLWNALYNSRSRHILPDQYRPSSMPPPYGTPSLKVISRTRRKLIVSTPLQNCQQRCEGSRRMASISNPLTKGPDVAISINLNTKEPQHPSSRTFFTSAFLAIGVHYCCL